MKHYFFICLFFLINATFAEKWDAIYEGKLIAKGEIDKVISHYQEAYYSPNRQPQDAFKIAELYVKKKDYVNALQWYEKESELVYSSKVNLYNYAFTHQLMGNYQKALDAYLMYAAQTGDVKKVMDLANQCEKVLRASSQTANYKLENYTYNTSQDEKYIAVLRTNPIYITTDKNSENTTHSIQQIVRAYDAFSKPTDAYKSGAGKLIITGISYTQDGNNVVFSAYEPNAKSVNPIEQLYFAENLGATLLHIKPFPFNVTKSNFKNPTFNANGTKLYFSSNQAGTIGGYDIWESKLVNGAWSKPNNLGILINSTSNEINPFMVQNGKDNLLYFASDRSGGFGGYDIYTSTNISNLWSGGEMQPAPINSAGDDVSIIYDEEIKTGYVVSDRLGGKGGLDIYRFIPFNLKLIVYTSDSITEQPIDYAMVQLFENGNKINEGVTDVNGKAIFQVDKDKSFSIRISKDNFRTVNTELNTNSRLSGDSVLSDISLIKDEKFAIKKGATNTISLDNFIVFTGQIMDAATNKPAKVKMRMVNYTTQKLRELDVDDKGRFEIRLLLNNNYKIILETINFKLADELTTLGLERNSIKVRDYLISGNKLKITDNRVYNQDNLPASISLENKLPATINEVKNPWITHEPITQSKIDSLIKLISSDKNSIEKTDTPNPKTLATKNIKTIDVPKPIKASQIPVVSIPPKETLPSKPEIQKANVEEPTIKEEPSATIQVAETNKSKSAIKLDSVPSVLLSQQPSINSTKEDETMLVANISNHQKVDKIKNKSKQEIVLLEDETPVEIINVAPPETPKTDTIKNEIKPTIITNDSVKHIVQIEAEQVKEVTPKVESIQIEKEVEKSPIAVNPSAPVVQNDNAIPKVQTPTVIPTPTKIELPELYYKIQISSFEQGNLLFPEFEVFGTIEEVNAYNKYIYRLGNYEDLERAKEILNIVRSQGYFVAFILQYNKEKISGIIN
ncbi:MAG TPA: hypothetical protein PLJ42_01040 [Chitinophagales bacterium]|jgi:tetratricopeptide (TPR) repeat protein|nr:hypothetical protein [Chitinophagales bacterium]HQW77987.1 hypothetical protein [Chitinophagales bacterium]HRB18488.1 hypothetical protein [Chitinophagales bacterium]HRB68684.1 hypothetical protein [Chitinophagales bacterium]HRB92073.1 hypothetical protein [Chitinophagales bacterium]